MSEIQSGQLRGKWMLGGGEEPKLGGIARVEPPFAFALELGQECPRAHDHRGRKPRQPRDLDAVAAIRPAWTDLVEEDDLVVPLAHRDVKVPHAGPLVGQPGQLVEVGGAEHLWARGAIVESLDHRPRDGQPIEGGRTSSDLVEVIALKEDIEFLRGTGSGGGPLGLRNKVGITLDPIDLTST